MTALTIAAGVAEAASKVDTGAETIVAREAGAEAETERPNVKSTEIVQVDGNYYYLHKVVRGETLSSLSRLYDVAIKYIKVYNPPVNDEGLKAGQTIKIPCRDIPEIDMSSRRIARRFEEYTVLRGETAYSIARKYSLTINTLVQDNPGLDPSRLAEGQKLRIRRSEIGEASPQEILAGIDDYARTLTEVSGGYIYYVVDIGETVYSISRKLGVTEADITDNNDLRDGLRAGAMLKIPDPASQHDYRLYQGGADDGTDAQTQGHSDPALSTTAPGYDGSGGALDIAMLLPLSASGRAAAGGNNFVEFYQGALLALEDLKDEGRSVNMALYDTERSVEKTSTITGGEDFVGTDLIIGPVYEECLQPVVEFAQGRDVPVVSPLAPVEGSYGGLLYQLSPSAEYRYDKLKDMFTPDKNIVFITTALTDTAFEREMQRVAGEVPFQRVVYNKGMPADYVDSLLISGRRDNLFVVLAADKSDVELVLAAISSVQNNRQARSIRTGRISVIGSPQWVRYDNINRSVLFKLNVSFVANYHADRSNEAVAAFDRRYIAAFGTLPSLFSYRGYDAVKLFAGSMLSAGGDWWTRLARAGTPLQSGYDFRPGPGGNTVNTEWALVTYRNDYTITVR